MRSIESSNSGLGYPPVPEHRISLIRAGIVGASFYMSDREVLLYPFLDYLYLLFQPTPPDDPIAFLVWQNDKCIFSSFSDAYYCEKYRLAPEHLVPPSHGVPITDGVMLTVHRIRSTYLRQLENSSRSDDFEQHCLFEPDHGLMWQVYQLLHADHKADNSWLGLGASEVEHKLELIANALVHDRSPRPALERLSTCDDLAYREDVLPLMEPVRSILDDVFQEARESELSSTIGSEPSLGNVFCAVRTACYSGLRYEAFPYSAGLLLSTSQRIELLRWCSARGRQCSKGRRSGDECIEALEMPLGRRSRSVADVSFCSGIIDFGREASDEVWDRCDPHSKADASRVQVERCIYPSNASLYYVPVHVQGIPWMAAFTFSPSATGHEPTRWLHNYTFYRDIMQRAAALLRLRVEREYVSLASAAAARAIVSWQKPPHDIAAELNAEWHRLARVYPFPSLQATFGQTLNGDVKRGATVSVDTAGQGTWSFRAEDNPFFGAPHVRYRQVSPAAMAERVLDATKSQLAQRRSISLEETSRSLAYSSHLLNTPLDALYAAADDSTDVTNRERLKKDIEMLRSFADFSMAVVDDDRHTEIKGTAIDATGGELGDEVSGLLRDVLEMLSDHRVSRTKARAQRARDILDGLSESMSHALSSNVSYRYYPSQLRVVVMELVTNAIRHMQPDRASLCVELGAASLKGRPGVCIVVTNPVGRSAESTAQLAERMTSGPSDLIGVMTVRLSCLACGFEKPRWKDAVGDAGQSLLKACVQIAEEVISTETHI